MAQSHDEHSLGDFFSDLSEATTPVRQEAQVAKAKREKVMG